MWKSKIPDKQTKKKRKAESKKFTSVHNHQHVYPEYHPLKCKGPVTDFSVDSKTP